MVGDRSRALMSNRKFEFVFEFAVHEFSHDAFWRLALIETLVDARHDWHVDVVFLSQYVCATRRFDALGDGNSAVLNRIEIAPLAEFDAERSVARQAPITRECQIAQAAESRHRERFAAQFHA